VFLIRRPAVSSALVASTLLSGIAPVVADNPRQGKRLALIYCARCHATDKVSPSPLKIAPPFRILHER
jgi:hypothetical protein